MSHKQTPRDFLKLIIGRPVVVKLNSGADYRGVLISLDGYMNVVLEQTEEYVDGQLKNKYGDTFIRGNNENKDILRGNFDFRSTDQRIVFTMWENSKRFHLLSNYHESESITVSPEEQLGTIADIVVPKITQCYKSAMGGVDKSDKKS